MSILFTKDALPEKYKKYIGEFTYGVPQIFDWQEGARLIIGKFCSIADNVKIFLGGEHRTDWITTFPFSAKEFNDLFPEAKKIKGHPKTKGDVIIGNDVWIGYDAIILSGVKNWRWSCYWRWLNRNKRCPPIHNCCRQPC
jgi:acetyltransferase-like isoleucine patch superfamily enzyme